MAKEEEITVLNGIHSNNHWHLQQNRWLWTSNYPTLKRQTTVEKRTHICRGILWKRSVSWFNCKGQAWNWKCTWCHSGWNASLSWVYFYKSCCCKTSFFSTRPACSSDCSSLCHQLNVMKTAAFQQLPRRCSFSVWIRFMYMLTNKDWQRILQLFVNLKLH